MFMICARRVRTRDDHSFGLGWIFLDILNTVVCCVGFEILFSVVS